jgi:hypothetical protein
MAIPFSVNTAVGTHHRAPQTDNQARKPRILARSDRFGRIQICCSNIRILEKFSGLLELD